MPIGTESFSQVFYTIDSFRNGLAFGQHRSDWPDSGQNPFSLRLLESEGLMPIRGRYLSHTDNSFAEVEHYLARLSHQGLLSNATLYFGIMSDPFHPFEGKFDVSMKFLKLFERYLPGRLVIQTRSPLVVIGMPTLRRLGERVAVTIAVETCDQDLADRYTPGLPRLEERFKAALTLRRFGIEVTVQVNPLLPYGRWTEDADRFAKVLVAISDHIQVRALCTATPEDQRRIKKSWLAQKLAADRLYHWLRPDSAGPLLARLCKLAPEKLHVPTALNRGARQLRLFAA
jgi:DNA repair photolyase